MGVADGVVVECSPCSSRPSQWRDVAMACSPQSVIAGCIPGCVASLTGKLTPGQEPHVTLADSDRSVAGCHSGCQPGFS